MQGRLYNIKVGITFPFLSENRAILCCFALFIKVESAILKENAYLCSQIFR